MEARLSASGMLATGYDTYSTRARELEYVWKGPFQPTFVRCLFILARYLAILIHITNVVLSSITTAKFPGNVQAPSEFCKSSLIFEVMSCFSMLIVLHLILMLRVWALYNQSLNLGLFLLTLLIGRNAGGIFSSWAALKHPSYVKFGEDCFPKMTLLGHPLENPMFFVIYGELITQFILHGLAWKRTLWDLRGTLPSQPALLSVLNRDSLRVFMGISVSMTAIAIAVITRGKPGLFIFPLFISFLSAAGTRMILNLQTLHAAGDTEAVESSRPKALVLTEIDDFATWDTSTFLDEPLQNMRSRAT